MYINRETEIERYNYTDRDSEKYSCTDSQRDIWRKTDSLIIYKEMTEKQTVRDDSYIQSNRKRYTDSMRHTERETKGEK